jgi:hypothetical protein
MPRPKRQVRARAPEFEVMPWQSSKACAAAGDAGAPYAVVEADLVTGAAGSSACDRQPDRAQRPEHHLLPSPALVEPLKGPLGGSAGGGGWLTAGGRDRDARRSPVAAGGAARAASPLTQPPNSHDEAEENEAAFIDTAGTAQFDSPAAEKGGGSQAAPLHGVCRLALVPGGAVG